MNHNPNCPDCNGTGEVLLLTSKAPCTCRTDVIRIHDEVIAAEGSTGVECLSCGDEAHATAACPLVSMTPCPAQQRDRSPTYTLELRTPHGTFTYTGLTKGEVEAGAVLQRGGAPYDRIKNHFEECQTAARVRAVTDRENQERLALGFSLGEIDAAATEIRKDIENTLSRKNVMEAISRGILRLMIRRTINGMTRASGGNTQYLAQMAKNNMLSVSEAFQASAGREVDFAQIEARLLAHFADGEPLTPPKVGLATGGRVCGKVAFLKQMYGGNPTKVGLSYVDESHNGTITACSQAGHRIDAVLLDGTAVLAVACNTREGWVDVYADASCSRVGRKHGKVELRWKSDAPGWMRTQFGKHPGQMTEEQLHKMRQSVDPAAFRKEYQGEFEERY